MNTVYAQVSDITALGRTLTAMQSDAAEGLIETASAKLRLAAVKCGKNLDDMIADPVTGEDYALVVRSVVVQAVCRALSSIADASPALTQASQSALGYSATMTYLNAGQSLYFLRKELRELGLLRQQIGVLEVYGHGTDERH